MTAGTARRAPSPGTARLASSPVLRRAWLYAASRRLPAAAGLLVGCAVCLRAALAYGHWDAYGALQLPLIAEAGCAAVIAVTAGSPFGEPERATGRWLPFLRLGGAILLTAVAAGVLIAAGLGVHLSGGFLAMLRNLAGLTGLGLLGAVLLGGPLAWTGPLSYLLVSVFALYTDWHPPTLSTPWLWPGRPPHDVGGALCAVGVFVAGLIAYTACGARDK